MTGTVRQWLLGLELLAASWLPAPVRRRFSRACERTGRWLEAREGRKQMAGVMGMLGEVPPVTYVAAGPVLAAGVLVPAAAVMRCLRDARARREARWYRSRFEQIAAANPDVFAGRRT